MVVLAFELKKRVIVLFNFLLWFAFFSYFTMLYHVRKLASLFTVLFTVLSNQIIIFLCFNCFK